MLLLMHISNENRLREDRDQAPAICCWSGPLMTWTYCKECKDFHRGYNEISQAHAQGWRQAN